MDNAVKAAQAMEAAAKDAGEIARVAGSPSTEEAVNKMATKSATCSRCGDAHSPSRAGKRGTLSAYAEAGGRAAHSSSNREQASFSKHVARVAAASVRGVDVRQQARVPPRPDHVAPEDSPVFDMWHAVDADVLPSSAPPSRLTVEVSLHPITMELDTTASVSVMAGKLFKRAFSGVPVEASGVMLRSYSGQLSPVEGQAHVRVRFGDRELTLSLYLTRRSSPTLLGRNWIHALGVRLPEY
ncbi:hypothetical protein HPB50_010417 [Hyalomma asiaticum]|uniref:Uncharacterized protein n=1 Tax=Hyalomma asiaticum TaxID=266040 RepID=A0ACB7SI86_HYAAI|nr:hypothetical protein HPB50_010417 [Hyalomma asiaticum]